MMKIYTILVFFLKKLPNISIKVGQPSANDYLLYSHPALDSSNFVLALISKCFGIRERGLRHLKDVLK